MTPTVAILVMIAASVLLGLFLGAGLVGLFAGSAFSISGVSPFQTKTHRIRWWFAPLLIVGTLAYVASVPLWLLPVVLGITKRDPTP